jgi:hypothetical protein
LNAKENEMNTSQETTHILKAMIEAACEISSIPKSKQAYGYKYATLDSLIDMLRGVLPKHGLWFMQMPTTFEGRFSLTTRVFHESGEWIEDSIEMTDTELQGKANDTQKVGASITYFRRYALSSIFGVASDEDVDGNVNSRQTPRQQTVQRQESKKDPLQYVLDDFNARSSAGESVSAIKKDYSDLLGGEQVGAKIKELDPEKAKTLATALYLRNRAK